jgi:hypothetical protein
MMVHSAAVMSCAAVAVLQLCVLNNGFDLGAATAAAAAKSCIRRIIFDPNIQDDEAIWMIDSARMAARRH